MFSFAHPALLWGLALTGVPVLIHLINMFRHRRVQWAAMEFLLASQQKNRSRVILRQLLLLLARMAAIAVLVLMLAQPRLEGRWGSLFGGGRTHHVVLLDDSFSMSDRWGDSSAFAEAKAVIERIGRDAVRSLEPQTFTLLRFSRVDSGELGTRPEMLEETVDSGFADRLREVLDRMEVSQTAAGPIPVLEAVERLTGNSAGRRSVYLISDFRARQWRVPGDLKNRLDDLQRRNCVLQLINCVDSARPNLAIEALEPGEGTRAAGVPLFMEVSVANYGLLPVDDVPVLLTADGNPRPAVKVGPIPAGESVSQRFSVQFPSAGEHRVVARLGSDPVAVDNTRHAVIDFQADLPVLLIDSDPAATDAGYIGAALAPGGPVATGVTPRIEKPRYLSLNELDQFRAIYLLNVERLDRSAIATLEQYISGGGGVGVFLGPRSNAAFVNSELYRAGQGFFPLPLVGQEVLLIDRLRRAPDLQVTKHPIFRVFAGNRNGFISTVAINRYFSVPRREQWPAEVDPATTRTIASLRNGDPLAIERDFGKGRVVVFLTTAGPEWNNWARNNPSFVVAMLDLQAYLSRRPQADESYLVGQPLLLRLDPSRYARQVRFETPGMKTLPATVVDAVPHVALQQSSEVRLETPGAGALPVAVVDTGPDVEIQLEARFTDTPASGLYRATLTHKDGSEEVRSFAFNVEPAEGDLNTVTASELAEALDGLAFRYDSATAFRDTGDDLAGYRGDNALFYVLLGVCVLLLIGEQLLAYSTGYHPPSSFGRVSAEGGR